MFEVVASHTKKILSVSGVQYGSDNDKIISRSDSAILCIGKEGNILRDTTSKYYKDDGSVTDKHGNFYILLMKDTTFGLSLLHPLNMSPTVQLPMFGANRLNWFTRGSNACFEY